MAKVCSTHPRFQFRIAMNVAAGLGLAILAIGSASGNYVGESYMQIPALDIGGKGDNYAKWLRLEAFYWDTKGPQTQDPRLAFRRDFRALYYSGPTGPRSGVGQLVGSIDRRSPLLKKVLASCANKKIIPNLVFATNSARSRGLSELGWERPPQIPAYFQYRLKDVQFVDCPLPGAAPEQAVVIKFGDIEWLNYTEKEEGLTLKLEPASLPPTITAGATKTFVVTWFGQAADVSVDQCERFNPPPSEDQFYELLPKEVADKERADRAKTGGVSYQDGTMELRGPNRLNAVRLPGIVRDPGQVEPKTSIARGLNLDGDDGKGTPPSGVCKHDNFVSEDGRTGIDNQLYRVIGCSSGFQGRKGFLVQYSNEQRRNGTRQTLVHITGINDEKNDDRIEISVLYSDDPMAKSADGKSILSDYTYQLTKVAELGHYSMRFLGKIVDGAVVASPGQPLRFLDFAGHVTLENPALRFVSLPDGSMKGVVGGYMDWRRIMMMSGRSSTEYNHGLQIPAWYNAFKRHADGLKNPSTGQCDGISAAYDIDAVPAFLPPKQQESLIVGQNDTSPKAQ